MTLLTPIVAGDQPPGPPVSNDLLIGSIDEAAAIGGFAATLIDETDRSGSKGIGWRDCAER